MESPVCLFVDVPICAFRPYESREYQDTHPFPPPSAVYGMLLSLCGIPRAEKSKHRGVAMALALESAPERSKVFRKLRRGKELGDLRPDYQDILVGLRMWIWLAQANDEAKPPLPARVFNTLTHPETITRFGGLSLGESSYLVNAISLRQDPPDKLLFLAPNPRGFYSLPVWIDHANNASLRRRFNLDSLSTTEALNKCQFYIGER